MSYLTGMVSESLALEQEFVKAKDAVEDVVKAITKMVKLVEKVLAALDAIPDAESLIQLITSGQLKKIADIGQTLRIGEDLPKLVNDSTEALPTVTGFVAKLEQQGPKLRGSFSDIISNAWLEDAQVATEAAGNARASIVRVQGIFRGQIFSIVQDVTAKVSGIYGALTDLPFHGRSLSIEVNVASYQRWSPVSFDMPCSRIDVRTRIRSSGRTITSHTSRSDSQDRPPSSSLRLPPFQRRILRTEKEEQQQHLPPLLLPLPVYPSPRETPRMVVQTSLCLRPEISQEVGQSRTLRTGASQDNPTRLKAKKWRRLACSWRSNLGLSINVCVRVCVLVLRSTTVYDRYRCSISSIYLSASIILDITIA